jgi:hypothetical protein
VLGNGGADLLSQLIGGGEEAHHAIAAQLLAECPDAPALVAVTGVRVHPARQPGSGLIQQEHQTGLAVRLGVAVLQLGDRPPIGVVVVGDVAVAVGEDPDVQVAAGHVLQALGERSLVGSDVVLHRDRVVIKLAQCPVDLLPVFLEVAVGGGDVDPVDPGHVPPPGSVASDGERPRGDRLTALSAWRT